MSQQTRTKIDSNQMTIGYAVRLALLALTCANGWSEEATKIAKPDSEIKSDEVVWFFPTHAHLSEDGETWVVPIHGKVFEPELDSIKRSAAIAAFGVQADSAEQERLEKIMRLFLVDNEGGKRIQVAMGEQYWDLGKSDGNGHFTAVLKLDREAVKTLSDTGVNGFPEITFRAVTKSEDRRTFKGWTRFVPTNGVSIISDIDDTIKITEVTRTCELLKNTFLRPFKAVPGMADLYKKCSANGVPLHFVSGSPWLLYEPLRDFLEAAGFPAGAFHLKPFRLKPTDKDFYRLLLSQEKFKQKTISEIFRQFPGRGFILVGDSGEQDPEIYGQLARDHSGQVLGIFIRKVTEPGPEDERYRKAFDKLPKAKWRLFEKAEEISEPLLTLTRK